MKLQERITELETEITPITKEVAVSALETHKVYAKLNDGTEDRILAIAWTKCSGAKTTHYVDDIEYFFVKN